MKKLTKCKRCGCEAIAEITSQPNARPFRKALRGYCIPCVVVRFFQGDEENGIGFALPLNFDPQGLKLPHLQAQFARVLTVGHSELGIEQIDWDQVIAKWRLG